MQRWSASRTLLVGLACTGGHFPVEYAIVRSGADSGLCGGLPAPDGLAECGQACSFAVFLVFCGVVMFCLPPYGVAEMPSLGGRSGSAALGGLLWAEAALMVARVLGLSVPLTARVGTVAFAVALIVGLAVQRYFLARELRKNGIGRGTL